MKKKHKLTPVEKLENFMSKWLDDTLKLVSTVAAGTAGNKATDKAVADLTNRVTSDEADETELKQVVTALIAQLAAAPAPGTAGTSTPVAIAPTVSGIAPTSGSVAGGTLLTVSGTGLDTVTSVTVGGVEATGLDIHSDTSLECVVPAGTGTVPVIVTSPAGTSDATSAPQFTFS